MKAIANGIILTEQGEITGKALLFDERFQGIVSPDEINADEFIDAQGRYIAPGLVDVHIHGYLGEDTSDGSEEGIRTIARGILANGVTSFLPTTMTVDWRELEAAFDVVRRLMPQSRDKDFDGAEIIGCHAEGPFIDPQRKGAQSADHILPPQADRLLAHRDIVVSIGHSSATYEQALEAIKAGASHITHLFNAMTGLNHRKPGIVGAALTTDVYAELIADAFHVHSGLFHLLHVAKGDRLVLVTDCTRAGGLPDGEYTLGGQPIFVKGIESRLQDGTIAGSVLHLNDAVRNLHRLGGVSLLDAVHAASLSAARSIGADERKGSIRHGKDADFILMDENCQVHATYVGGLRKYAKEN